MWPSRAFASIAVLAVAQLLACGAEPYETLRIPAARVAPVGAAIPRDAVIVIPIAGQSNADGVGGADIQTSVASRDFTACQDQASNVVEAIDADSPTNCLSNRERPSGGLAYGLRQRIDHRPAIIIVPCGVGASGIDTWDPQKGVHYQDCQRRIARIAREVAKTPDRFQGDGSIHIPFVGFWHGEANYTTDPGDARLYAVAMSRLRAAFDFDAKALTGQTADVLMFSEIPASFSSSTSLLQPPASVVGQAEACATDPKINCVGSAAALPGETTPPWLTRLVVVTDWPAS